MNESDRKYDQTLRAWNDLAQAYQDKFMDLEIYDQSYDLFCKFIAIKNPSILEIGCGPGNITRYLSSKRPDFKILATDAAPAMIKLAQKNNPQQRLKKIDAREINRLGEKFDGIVCGFVLPYLDKKDCEALISNCSTLLNNGAVFYLSFIEGKYENSLTQKSSDGKITMFVHYYEEHFLKSELEKNGLSVIHTERILYECPDRKEVHLALLSRKKT